LKSAISLQRGPVDPKVRVEGRGRVANRPGMAGTVPELTHTVPCPGLTRICTGIVCYCQLALLTSSQLIVLGLHHSSCCLSLRNEYVAYVSVLPIYSLDEYAGIVIFYCFLQRLLGFGVLRVVRIVRLLPAEPARGTDALNRCLSTVAYRRGLVGVRTPHLQPPNFFLAQL